MPEVITLDIGHPAIQYLRDKDERLAKVISMVGPISYVPHNDNTFAFLIHEIIEQMLSVKAGQKIYERLEILCGGDVSPEKINTLSDVEIRAIGTSSSKVKSIRNVTNAVLCGDLNFDEMKSLTDQEVTKKLTRLHGVGNWTAKMFLIFVLNREDILPLEDSAFLQSYRWLYQTEDISANSVKERCMAWKPYSSFAARYLYRALDNGLVKTEFHL